MASEANTVGDERIGGYRYIRMIHAGQNSSVMEVLQEGTGRRFVMKQLLGSKTTDPAERKAFDHEARLGQILFHPNLIRVHEYAKLKDQPFFVMDYFPSNHMGLYTGRPEKYQLPKGRLHTVIKHSGSGLAYMHDRGWIHRDIKPANIIVNKGGEARLIDYALALKVYSLLQKLMKSKPIRQGTASYMSPEQILRMPPDPVADIYSFGISCYEMASGRKPFTANSSTDLLSKHLRDVPTPPTLHNKRITPEFSELVMSMIRKKPADRPQSMHEVLSRHSRLKIYLDDPDPISDGF